MPAVRRQKNGSRKGLSDSTATFCPLTVTPAPSMPSTRIESIVASDAAPAAPAPAAWSRPWDFTPCVAAYALSITVALAPVSTRKSSTGPPSSEARTHRCRDS